MFRVAAVVSMTLFAAFVLLGNFLVQGQRPEPPTQSAQEIKPIVTSPAKQAQRTQRIREGTVFKDMLVFFRQNGDRTVLYTADDNRRFTCLENLALERVLTALHEKPEYQFWKIDGEFSEFRGENFVRIRRFVVARAPADTTP